MPWLWQGSEEPKDIPQRVYAYLVITLKVDPDHLRGLKCVQKMNYVGSVLVTLIRIFNPREAQRNGMIIDFASLDQHPEFIVYEGCIEKRSGAMHIEPAMEKERKGEDREP